MTEKEVEFWSDALLILFVLIYNGIILGFTTYIVFWMGFSGWWFLLAVLLLASFRRSSKKDEDED